MVKQKNNTMVKQKSKKLFLLMFLFLVSLTSVNVFAVDNISSGIDYYTLNNSLSSVSTSNVLSESGISYTTGKIGNGSYFDNNADYLRNTSFNFGYNKSFSFGFGLKLNSTYASATKTNNYVLSDNDIGTANTFLFKLNIDGTDAYKMNLIMCKESVSCSINTGYFTMNTTIFDYVVLIYNGSTHIVSLYVNDVLYYNDTFTDSTSVDITSGFSFGNSETAGYAISPLMVVDELSIYNRVLSSSEISDLYNKFMTLDSYPFETNFTLTLKSSFNNYNVQNFSAIINGVQYDTTSGYILTNLAKNSSVLKNISFINISDLGGFFNVSYVNYNLSSNLQGETYQANVTFKAYQKVTSNNLNGNITNGTTNYGLTDVVLPWNAGTYNVTFSNSSHFNKTQQITISALSVNIINISDVFNSYVNLTFINAFNNVTVTGVTYNVSESVYGFNETGLASTGNVRLEWINGSTINITATTSGQSYNDNDSAIFLVNSTSFFGNITLRPIALYLLFTKNGTNSVSVSGRVDDSLPSSRNFSSTNVLIVQSNLSLGKVSVLFNGLNSTDPWSQYYEYINDWTTTQNDILGVINTTNSSAYPLWSAYVLVKDLTNSPLSDVYVRYSAVGGSLGSNNTGLLIGQRLTGDDGKTFIVAEKQMTLMIYAFKDGYTPIAKLIQIGDESFTSSEPLTIILTQNGSLVKNSVYLNLPNSYNDPTSNIKGIIIIPEGYNQVLINTTYRDIINGTQISVDREDAWGWEYFTLTSGLDFNSSTYDDINVTIYIDGNLYRNLKIVYHNDSSINEIFPVDNTSTGLSSKSGAVIEGIGLIIMIILLNLIFSDYRVGFHAFMVGTVVLALVNPVYFWWLGLIGGVYYVIRIIKMVIGE